MSDEIIAWLVVDEKGKVYNVYPCDGLAYERKDSLEAEYPDMRFYIKRRSSREER